MAWRQLLPGVQSPQELPTVLPLSPHVAEYVAPTLRVSVKGQRQIELKVVYKRQKDQTSQTYRLSVYVFYPRELEAVQTNFFSHMFQTVRLHVPEVTLADLASERVRGSGSPFQFLQRPSPLPGAVQSAEEISGAADKLIQQLQLAACVLRSAIRSAAKSASHTIQAQSGEEASAAAVDLVAQIKIGLAHFEQSIAPFEAQNQPASLRHAAQLVQEFLLLEAENTLLRLLQDSFTCVQQKALASRCICNPLPLHGQPKMKLQPEAALVLLAQDHLTQAVLYMQEKRTQHGCPQSYVHEADPRDNEEFTQHIKLLKRNARSSVTLFHQNQEPAVLRPILVDVVGATIAGLAMLWQILTIFIGQKASHVRINNNPQGIYAGPYMVMSVIGYMLKDRIKEWGKRYLQPVAHALGLEFPDRIAKVINHHGQAVGKCWESCQVASDKVPSAEVQEQRRAMHKASTGPSQPERVLIYRKKMTIKWEGLCEEAQAVQGLDDVTRLDLAPFCRKMEPSQEAYYRLKPDSSGSFQVQEVSCARVYNLHVVFRAALCTPRTAEKLKSQICRATVVMDQKGIKRMEV